MLLICPHRKNRRKPSLNDGRTLRRYRKGWKIEITFAWLAGLVVFIASHAFGQGTVIWVFIGEVCPNRVCARGQALGSLTHWVVAASISWSFPMIAAASGWMTFAFYALYMVGELIWVLAIMPETKGISPEKIQQKLGIK